MNSKIAVKPLHLTLRHAAISVTDLERSLKLVTQVLGFSIYHNSDKDWAMVQQSGTTLSLVRVGKKDPVSMATSRGSHPAHLGLVAGSRQEVQAFHVRLKAENGISVGAIEDHRDGSYGFYFHDFDGNQFECIFIPYESIQKPAKEKVLVLLAHGSQDADWRKPLEQLHAKVQAHSSRIVVLCYMEFCTPTLEVCVSEMVAKGERSFEVVPVFISSGKHVKEDVPHLIAACEKKFPNATFRLRSPIGELESVQEAIAAAVLSL